MRTIPLMILITIFGALTGYCEDTNLSLIGLPDDRSIYVYQEALRKGDTDKVKSLVAAYPLLAKTPLFEAGCNVEMLQFLLNHGAEESLDSPSQYGGVTAFQSATARCGKEVIELFLAHKVNVNARFSDGRAPLHVAASRGLPETVACLLDHHADIEAKDSNGATPLYLAAEAQRIDVVKLLIARGANVNITVGQWPVLFLGIFTNTLLQALLEGKADPNLRETVNGQTCLYFADTNDAALLLQYKADVNARDNNGRTPLINAMDYRPKELMDFLLTHGAQVNIKDKSGHTALYWAAVNGHLDFIESLQRNGAKTPDAKGLQRAIHIGELFEAAWHDDTEKVKALLAGDPSLARETKQDGRTPLHEAVNFGSKKVVNLLLTYGANINVRDDAGRTPLWWAISNNQFAILDVLLAHHADVNVKDNSGQTLLQMAEQGHCTDALKLLRQQGAK